jgi:hypothetical protein
MKWLGSDLYPGKTGVNNACISRNFLAWEKISGVGSGQQGLEWWSGSEQHIVAVLCEYFNVSFGFPKNRKYFGQVKKEADVLWTDAN